MTLLSAILAFAKVPLVISLAACVCAPKYALSIAVPCQVPVVIVHSVVILLEPAQVDNAVFSTLSNDNMFLTVDAVSSSILPLPAVFLPSSLSVAIFCVFEKVTTSLSIVHVLPLPETVISHLSQSVTQPQLIPSICACISELTFARYWNSVLPTVPSAIFVALRLSGKSPETISFLILLDKAETVVCSLLGYNAIIFDPLGATAVVLVHTTVIVAISIYQL